METFDGFRVSLSVYIVLLLVGGIMGFAKAGSKISLITSAVFAVLLAVCEFAPVPNGRTIVLALQVVLLAVFVMRLRKTKKFMPSGLMVAVTILALVLELALKHVAA
jgi:uncharacterized membrane protein (UPF0136 family)